jgi:branched-chain amino acid transport system substrate-binding protein
MNRHMSDEMIDARLRAYLDDRAETGAAAARTAERLAAEMAPRLRPRYRASLESLRVARLAWLAVLAALFLALLAALVLGVGAPRDLAPRLVAVAIELPIGGTARVAEPIVDGIRLAVAEVNGGARRFRVEIPEAAILSDVVDGTPDGPRGADNMRRITADPTVVAVIGPFNSGVAEQQIPISHAAGLLQCSPATTSPQLTAARSPNNFVRVVTTDDVAAAGAARYVFERLARASVFVVDDGDAGFGMLMGDLFTAEFTRLGGTVVSRASLPTSTAELATILEGVKPHEPRAIYFGGGADGGATLLRAAAQAGLGDIPLVGTEAINDGALTTPGSFLNRVGEDARNALSVFPGFVDGPGRMEFETQYRARFGSNPTPFAAAGHACAQVVIAALSRIGVGPSTSAAQLRESVRAAGVDPAASFETNLGRIAFDAHGDVVPNRVSIYAYDPAVHDWVYADQIDPASGFAR